jgi:hypothetical protein
MPLANTGGTIPVLLQKRSYSRAVSLYQWAIESAEYTSLEPGPPAVTTREQAVARWRAYGRGRMPIGNTYSFLGQSIHIGRGYPRIGILAPYIAIAHVISHDKQNVGPFITLIILAGIPNRKRR